MKRKYKNFTALALALAMGLSLSQGVQADSIEVKPYIAFGADLTKDQKKTVMDLLEVSKEDLADYETIQVTNQDEHDNLDSYLDASVIGTKALSSVKVEEADAGSGVEVETHNINFVTEEMYTNALVTAGITDAEVTVAAPFEISGTAALVGAMKAYETMTGQEISEESADAANNELVVTGELAGSVGSDKAAELVALLKNKVIDQDLSSEEEILEAVDEAAEELDIELTEEDRQKLADLMKKIADLDLDVDKLKAQAGEIYDKLSDLDIDMDQAKSILDKIGDFFGKVASFIQGLFS